MERGLWKKKIGDRSNTFFLYGERPSHNAPWGQCHSPFCNNNQSIILIFSSALLLVFERSAVQIPAEQTSSKARLFNFKGSDPDDFHTNKMGS